MIVFCHLLNDQSGSPRVLRSVIGAMAKPGDGSRLFVGSDGNGCLTDADLTVTHYWYRRSPWRLVTFFTFLLSQIFLIVALLRDRGISRDAIVYVNTLLPFGAALYGRLTGRRVVYHLHEVSVSPAPLRWFLVGIARVTASDLVYVSDSHRQLLPIGALRSHTVHNGLDADFLDNARQYSYRHRRDGKFRVLMLASLRDFKGVPEFLALASDLERYSDIFFDLVANDNESGIERYFSGRQRPANLTVYGRTANPSEYYCNASLVLNLSRADQCVETFGLTLLEAMAFGIPVIAPPVGGPLELINDGVEGYLIDSRDGEMLAKKVLQISRDPALCADLSAKARLRAGKFSPEAFAHNLHTALDL